MAARLLVGHALRPIAVGGDRVAAVAGIAGYAVAGYGGDFSVAEANLSDAEMEVMNGGLWDSSKTDKEDE